jgi:hypothetical protein
MGGQGNPYGDFGPQNFDEGHFIYQDQFLTLSAKIRKAKYREGYEYEMLIVNNNINPINLDYYNDILTMKHEGRIYSVGKVTSHTAYPESLEPGEGTKVIFQIDGIFSNSLKEIETLYFKLGEKRYALRKNPAANWQQFQQER